MDFLLPTGIGDSVWALHKIQAIRDKLDPGGRIDVHLACNKASGNETRAIDFVNRFSFVDSVQMFPSGSLLRDPWTRADGTLNYMDDGLYELGGRMYCVLIPNATLERGERLESWLPHYPIDWKIFEKFSTCEEERIFAVKLRGRIGPYAVFYPGPLHGNTINGHNRNSLWRPEDWITLGKRVHNEFNLHIVVVGASYDAEYFDGLIDPELNGCRHYWTNLIGATNIGELFMVTKMADFEVSYQAGAGIIPTYMGTPTAIFWRPKGDSINPDVYLSFDERMASAWVPPKMIESGAHKPLIYGRDGVQEIMEWARRWA